MYRWVTKEVVQQSVMPLHLEREAYFLLWYFYERLHTCSGQNTNKKYVCKIEDFMSSAW